MKPDNAANLVITACHNITAIGHSAVMTASSVRAGLSRFEKYDDYLDCQDNPITVARIRGLFDEKPNIIEKLSDTIELSMGNLLQAYGTEGLSAASYVHLILGVADEERPGPRYEEYCGDSLQRLIAKIRSESSLHILPYGNASAVHGVFQAQALLESDPHAICIVGCFDSLLRNSTLNWFEKDSRLKSESYGRHHAFIPGEAVGFLIMEGLQQARRNNRPVLAQIRGIGLSQEPTPRASGAPSRASGLTNACHAALDGLDTKTISTVFTDLNGENTRAQEFDLARMRCLPTEVSKSNIRFPAECYGDIGAATGAVLAATACQGFSRGWLTGPVLIACSDDHGTCGALVLKKGA